MDMPLPLRPNSTALHALVIHLGSAGRQPLPSSLGRALHAQVMHWLNLSNTEITQEIHRRQDSPFSLAGLIGHRRPGRPAAGDDFYFRISLIEGALMEPLLQGLELWGNSPLTLGNHTFALRRIHALPGSHRWVGSSDYSLLASTPQTSDDLTLRFHSPTSFKQAQGIQPFPLPNLVFGSLLRRWNTFAPMDLRFPEVEWQALVSAYDLKTHAYRMEGGPEIGCLGWVRYRFPDPMQARIATVLAHFAFFAGVGRKTAMGMGCTQLEPT